MKNCVIFCAAGFDGLAEAIGEQDYVIAADGGLRHVQALGIAPDAIIGDFDSLGYVPEQGVVFPVEKDDTDAMLAIKQGLRQGCTRFLIYGGMDGPRLDHTVANFQALGYLAQQDARGYLIGKDYIATVIKDGNLVFSAGKSGDFSLFCTGADASGVTIRGLYYEVENVTLTSHFPLGVSNHFTGQPVEITVTDGSLLALWPRPTGLPVE